MLGSSAFSFISDYAYYLFAFAGAFSVVLASVPIVRGVAIHCGRVDLPCDRKVHEIPMVRLGGVAIFVGTMVAALGLWYVGGFSDLLPKDHQEILVMLMGGAGYFLLGFLDDLYSLSPKLRLICQFAIATVVWSFGISIDFITVPSVGIVHLGWLSLPITLVWIAGMVNAINWIDGLDGLASGVSAISTLITACICLSMGEPSVALLAICLVGSLCGFLVYNFNPACIFMGDGGSYFIGFMLATISITGLVKGATAVTIPLIVLAVPIFDMMLVIVSRLIRRKSPFEADKSHLHHRLLKVGLSHRWTVLFIYALTLWMGCWAFLIVQIPYGNLIIAGVTPVAMSIFWKAWQSKEISQSFVSD
ncbi:glycosyltransferase family 4 protein [Leptothoe kymatousa]|uniref:Undecaprenyl/decaprenyl-phosphate alpha-N-acetylglucosaminyl 1-phosphate transferase n=1 Tax=Leptothoe kymatousa TAU-MAC 1615 TaxID=2364775 RepID=A0ABS5Y3T3_9CYAN|nr:undecaprenyl/decaprenyl-phosphate alpha-N-acetylglucosaminyl 1-phosphate transferase [Leptothoe kymatousa TAU-MAC 1615]